MSSLYVKRDGTVSRYPYPYRTEPVARHACGCWVFNGEACPACDSASLCSLCGIGAAGPDGLCARCVKVVAA